MFSQNLSVANAAEPAEQSAQSSSSLALLALAAKETEHKKTPQQPTSLSQEEEKEIYKWQSKHTIIPCAGSEKYSPRVGIQSINAEEHKTINYLCSNASGVRPNGILAFDIDGTLIDDKDQYIFPEQIRAGLAQAADNNILIILLTARSYEDYKFFDHPISANGIRMHLTVEGKKI